MVMSGIAADNSTGEIFPSLFASASSKVPAPLWTTLINRPEPPVLTFCNVRPDCSARPAVDAPCLAMPTPSSR